MQELPNSHSCGEAPLNEDGLMLAGSEYISRSVETLMKRQKVLAVNLQVRKGGLPPLERQRRDWLGSSSTEGKSLLT